jgi:hypothetical protein
MVGSIRMFAPRHVLRFYRSLSITALDLPQNWSILEVGGGTMTLEDIQGMTTMDQGMPYVDGITCYNLEDGGFSREE